MEPLRINNLVVRLAEGATDIDAVQALRYRVFYDEMGAQPTPEMAARRRDFDRFDDFCEHLLIEDVEATGGPRVVGTYRLNRRSVAERNGGFYSEDEYDLTPLKDYPGEIVEVGRSCVAPETRTGVVMQLLWRGIAHYVFAHDVKLLFGCASLPGSDPGALAPALGYLYRNHLAPPELRARALDRQYVDMRFPDDDGAADEATTAKALPPLIKGYLRLGGYVGDGAVVDYQFNTTDVFVVVETDRVTEKYYRHYERGAKPASARREAA
jgi:putative hemolysin